MQTQKSSKTEHQRAIDIFLTFYESYPRATDKVNKLYGITIKNIVPWVEGQANRWPNYQRVVRMVNKRLGSRWPNVRNLTDNAWRHRITAFVCNEYCEKRNNKTS